MKKQNCFHKIALSFAIVSVVLFAASCSNDDFFLMDFDDVENPGSPYIDVTDFHDGPKTALEKEQFKEATMRFSSRLIYGKDKTLYLIEGTTAEELNISESLFQLFKESVACWNENPTDIIFKPGKVKRTKGQSPESSTRGGNFICDAAATAIYNYMTSSNWPLASNLFNMWYFDNRSSDYTLSQNEWSAVSSYADSIVGSNYQNNSFSSKHCTYYDNCVSFYGNNADLKYSLGSCSIYFNASGAPDGMYDVYDFNKGDRSFVSESLTTIIRWIGDDGGFVVKYGVQR